MWSQAKATAEKIKKKSYFRVEGGYLPPQRRRREEEFSYPASSLPPCDTNSLSEVVWKHKALSLPYLDLAGNIVVVYDDDGYAASLSAVKRGFVP